jgi:3-oxochol-4-en-24-oyl-CoA dehydrogenase
MVSERPSQDVAEFQDVLRRFLAKKSPESAVRALMESPEGFDRAVWSQAATQLGLTGLVVPERLGGTGATIVELGVAFEEAGRALWCAPLLSTVGLASMALLEIPPSEVGSELLSGIVDGSTTATLAWGGLRPGESSITAACAEGGWELTGTADYVLDGARAEVLLVAARIESKVGLFVAQTAPGAGPVVQPLTTMDSTRRLAHLMFTRTSAELIDEDAAAGLERAVDSTELLLAAEQLGGATRSMEMAVEYAKERVQFGRPIGSFQAIKHRLADVFVKVEFARSAVEDALRAAAQHHERLRAAASLARSVCSEAYLQAAAANIQVHGGIGFTWEHPAHLYLKRAKSSELLFGSPKWHRSRIADLLAIPLPYTDRGGLR